MGTTATLVAARREVRAHSESVSSVLTVLALELTQMALFASLVALGVWLRNRTGYHKRLMLLATFCILSESHCPPIHLGETWKQHLDPEFLDLISYRSRPGGFDKGP
jgi:hypothetical protein